tara:strand:+ start:638 stop:1537 length:900 start_codon:yes stop_codon:yes gene_type:complete
MNHLLWQGRSALNGEPIALISKTSGNKKVKGKRSSVFALAVIPMATIDAIKADQVERPGATPIQRSSVYLASMKSGAIDSACDNACEHKGSFKCYAQFNAQSVTEPVSMILGVDSFGGRNGWKASPKKLASLLGYGAGDKFRLMIVGSTGALPEHISARLINDLESLGMRSLAYVENWRTRSDLRGSHMASCYSLDDVREAESMGWRAFWSPAAEDIGNTIPDGMLLCPGSKYYENLKGKRVGCGDCGLCDGASSKSSIINIRHGNGDSSRVSGLVRRGALSNMILNNSGRAIGAYVGV